MKITFLLGNGFDKALGLNTGYNDFYQWYLKQPVPQVDGAPVKHITKFKEEIDKYIKKSPDADPLWMDAEEALGAYTENFTLETVYDFIDCYEDFRDNLMTYLQGECERFTNEAASQISNLFIKQIENYYSELNNAEKRQFNSLHSNNRESTNDLCIIGFNYTDTLDKICRNLQNINLKAWRGYNGLSCVLRYSNLIHAHGYVNRIPIIGVCNEYMIKNKELLKSKPFRISMLKEDSINYAGEFWRENTNKAIDNSKVICIFGMSLGDTDSDYWERIISWLSEPQERHLIIFWYDKDLKNLNTSNVRNYDAKSKILKIFFNHSELTNEQFNALENRIHIVFNTKNMFQIDESTQKKLILPRKQENDLVDTKETVAV